MSNLFNKISNFTPTPRQMRNLMSIYHFCAAIAIASGILPITVLVFFGGSIFDPEVYTQSNNLYIYYIALIICLVLSLTFTLITLIFSFWIIIQNYTRKQLQQSKLQPTEQTAIEPSEPIPSPLKGAAAEHEQQIIEEIIRRGKRSDGTLNRAAVAQLLRALTDMKMLKPQSEERDQLMRWVAQITGYKETNVSAFNEAIVSATPKKVEQATQWLIQLFNS